jgi:hypothetical protein
MDKIRIRFDSTDNSLIVWFDEPQHMAYLSPIVEDAPGDLHLIKNDAAQVIGFECQFYQIAPGSLTVEMETAPLLPARTKQTYSTGSANEPLRRGEARLARQL